MLLANLALISLIRTTITKVRALPARIRSAAVSETSRSNVALPPASESFQPQPWPRAATGLQHSRAPWLRLRRAVWIPWFQLNRSNSVPQPVEEIAGSGGEI